MQPMKIIKIQILKMNRGLFFIYFILFYSTSSLYLHSQDKRKVSSETVDVVKPYQPDLVEKYKIPIDLKDEDKKINLEVDIDYDFKPFVIYPQVSIIDNFDTVKRAKYVRLRHNYVTLGSGNYMTPFLDFSYEKKYGKNIFNLRANHISSQGSKLKFKDIFGDTKVSLGYDRLLKNYIINAGISYQNNMLSYYGVDTSMINSSKEDEYNIYRTYHTISLDYSFKRKNKSKLYFQGVEVAYKIFTDENFNNENQLKLNTDLILPISKEIINTKVGYFRNEFNIIKSSKNYQYNYFYISPSFKLIRNNFNLDMGISLNYANSVNLPDNKGNLDGFYFFPNVFLSYKVYESYFIPYLNVTGYIINDNYYSRIVKVNPFLHYDMNIKHNRVPVHMYLGMKGILFSGMDYNFYISYVEENNFLMFTKEPAKIKFNSNFLDNGNSFKPIYDDVYYWKLQVDLKYQLNNRLKRVTLSGNYTIFEPKTFKKVLDKPNFSIMASALYYFIDELYIGTKLFFVGSRYASQELGEGKQAVISSLDSYFDANFDLNYIIDDNLLIMAKLNNLFGSYQIWKGYESQGIQVMLGINYKF